MQTQVYEFVIDSVINRSRRDFESMGFSESVLDILQKVCVDRRVFCPCLVAELLRSRSLVPLHSDII